MQCPRCSELVSDESTECPVCHKSLTTSVLGPGLRRTLTGDYIEQPTSAASSTSTLSSIAVAGQAGVENSHSAPTTPLVPDGPAPLRIVTVNADLNANLREAARQPVGRMPLPALDVQDRMKWILVLVALVGSLVSGYLWRYPIVAPITIHLSDSNVLLANTQMETTLVQTRAIPVPYLYLWGIYCLLAVATQFSLPSPWRFADSRFRTNWVLNVTGLFALLLFCGTGISHTGADLFLDEGIRMSQEGTYTVNLNGTSQQLSKSEAEQLVARTVVARERATFTQWNLAALVCYASLGGYAAWWLLTRPND